jgi:ABC-type branched-subunit amino acid transport system substrate-binding protein
LKIGLIIPLTGDFGGVGENVRKGIMTAQSLFEKQNGIKIPVIVEDDSADVVKGLSAYKKLVEIDKVNGLINTFTSTMDAIYDAVNNRDYPVMMEFFQANNVADDKVFQMTLGNDHVWDRYAKFIASSDLDQSKVALVYSVDAAQSSFAKAFEDAYGKEVTKFVVGSDKDGLRADAIKVASVKPNLIVFFMTPENGAIMTKNILPLIASTTKLAYDIQLTTGMSYYEQLLGGDLSKINGAIALMFEGDTNSNEYKEFLSEYQKLYPNEQPGFLADYGYDTFMTYVRTFSSNNVKWRENLKNFSGSGASGAIEFDENGVRISPLVIKTVEDGKLVTTERLP